jgi:DNA primase
MLDGDEAGRDAAVGIVDRLQRIVYQVRLVDLPQGAQPDQLTVNELQRVLAGIAVFR